MAFWQFGLHAQQAGAIQASTTPASFNEGYMYMTGMGKQQDQARALQVFKQAASQGDSRAMNALGNMYANGIAVAANPDSAVLCYRMAGQHGYASGYANLGRLYQTGTGVTQDFAAAAKYYQQAANLGDDVSKNWLAYLYYKGFGVTQSYSKAFAIYQELAQKGMVNAQYFLGLCYRNGYGTAPDNELAKQWLMKAAAKRDRQSIHELTAEPKPENMSVLTNELQERLASLKNYNEKFEAAATNDIGGTYKGYAVYYDFSHQYAHEIVPLTLTISKKGGRYEGAWTESDTLTAPIKATFNDYNFSFDSSSKYTRRNYYSYEDAEPYLFNSAALSIKYFKDSVFLSGDVQFYSIVRKEPGQPMYISLSRKASDNETAMRDFRLNLSPNPAVDLVNVVFTIGQSAKLSLQLIGLDGKILQQISPETLPAGSYSFPFSVQGLPAGNYLVKLTTGAITQSKIFVKL